MDKYFDNLGEKFNFFMNSHPTYRGLIVIIFGIALIWYGKFLMQGEWESLQKLRERKSKDFFTIWLTARTYGGGVIAKIMGVIIILYGIYLFFTSL